MTTTEPKIARHARRVLEMMQTDEQLQELAADEQVLDAIKTPGLTIDQIVEVAFAGYAARPALGEREYDVVADPATGRQVRSLRQSFRTITYRELQTRVKNLAAAWQSNERHRVGEDDFVCILGFSGIDFVTVDLALAYVRAVTVPLQTTLAGTDLDGIFTDTAPVTVAATMSDLLLAAQYAGSHATIRSIIAMDFDERVDDDRDQYAAAAQELAQNGSRAELITLGELIAYGDFHQWQPVPVRDDTMDRLSLLVHSSGSTGTPKGAMILQRNAGLQWRMLPPDPVPMVRLCFAPLNHMLGRGQVYTALARGATAFFTARSDMSTLFEDFRLVRPTEIAVFPRILEMVHRSFLSEVARRTAEGGDQDEIEREVMESMRHSFLGDRLVLMVSSGAPITPELERFTVDCFQVTFVDGYGNTEAGGSVTVRNRINRSEVIDYKLRDVPELGYFVTDRPYPRGELVLQTRQSVPGYFKKPEATAALFDAEGYLRTGDIMEERGPDHLVYIDRRNDVLKLAQGEFVTCGAVGNVFEAGSDVIQQIYVYGNASRAFLLAVVVPNLDVARARLGHDPKPDELKTLIRSELKAVAMAENLRTFELPRDFIIEFEPFSHENGLLSSVHKRMRPNLQRRYGEALEQLYADLERKQNDELLALRADSGLTVLEKVGKALEATIGVEDIDLTRPFSFTELGGDSLGATGLSALLSDVFGVEVPVTNILSPAGNAAQWAKQIETALSGENQGRTQRTFSQTHGDGARELHARDLDIVNFLDADLVRRAAMDSPPTQTRAVLLTGATGFLGRFLAIEWLERLAAVDGKLFCLVRAADQPAAVARLRAGLEGDTELIARFDELAERHLEVLVGDVADGRLGLDDATYARLATAVDRIVHPAALVNHMLEYEYLFGPNVAGTAELIGLALTDRQKHFDFVSSLAATRFVDRTDGNDERSPLRPHIELTDDYGSGYGATKWASEILLHSAHQRFGLASSVLRGDMMLPHSRFHGQINVPDVFIRLLFSLVTTELAPWSFYEPRADGQRVRGHYDGLPVDFVAGAVAGLGELPHDGVRTYNMINYLDDGVSLDTIVDWIETAGYRIDRIADHREWITKFEARLKALPEQLRQHSSVQVLDPFRHAYKEHGSVVGSDQFIDGVARLPIGPEVPHISEAFIHKCLDDMRRHGLIPAPAVAG